MICGCGTSDDTKDVLSESELKADIGTVTRDQAEQLTAEIDAAVTAKNSGQLTALIDESKFFDRVFRGLDLTGKARQEFMIGVRSGGGLNKLSGQIIDAAKQGGGFDLVRYVEEDNTVKPLFRLMLPEMGGVNYFKLTLSANGDGKARIADMFIYLTGEPLTQTMRRLLVPVVAHKNRSLLARLSGEENDLITHQSEIQRIQQSIASGQFRQSLTQFDQLPESLRQNQTLIFMRLAAAQQVDEEEYKNTVLMMQKLFKDSPSSDFRMIDYYALTMEQEKVIETLDRLKTVIGDPYLDALKLDAFIALGRFEEGKKVIADVRAKLPKLDEVRFAQVGLALEMEDYQSVAEHLTDLKSDFKHELVVEGVPEYAGFVKSDAYRTWKARN